MIRIRRCTVFLSAVLAAGLLAGCQKSQETSVKPQISAAQEETSPTQTPSPEPTETPAPMAQADPVKYVTDDEKMILYLPDRYWENVSDQDGIRLFEAEGRGKISILHGTKEELDDFLIPDSEKAVEKFYKENGVSKKDFQILRYVNNSIGDLGIYRYTVQLQEEAGFEYVYSVNYVVAAEDEIYSVAGTVEQDDESLLEQIQDCVESLQICRMDQETEDQEEDGAEAANGTDSADSEDYSEDPQFVKKQDGE